MVPPRLSFLASSLALLAALVTPLRATTNPYLGDVSITAGPYAPNGWRFCDGQLMSIAAYPALFSILGTTYGGDGQTTFALPDLRARATMGEGSGPGLTSRPLGSTGGADLNLLVTSTIPSHTHQVSATDAAVDTNSPASAGIGTALVDVFHTGTPDTTMGSASIGHAGSNQPFSIHQPSLGLRFIIAVEGIYPSHN